MGQMLGGGFGLVVILFLFILAILWFLLPFAIFGTKDKLTELIQESQKTNEQLAALRDQLASISDKDISREKNPVDLGEE
ncbi:MAG: hypothetical protein OEY36_06295 [Gammaproteobacteria bacterium]|nr:hypothetical protein [Gammaproteobacteria bacterium]